MAAGPFLLALVGIALTILLLYLFYSWANRAFQRVGFTAGEASLILLGSLIGSVWNIPIWPEPVGGGWILAVNVGGAVVPFAVSVWLLHRVRTMALPVIVGTTLVTLATYAVTRAAPEGIVAPAGLALIPPVVAAAISLTSYWREEEHAAPLAYVSGTFGALIGADVLRLAEFLGQPAPEPGAVASIGGAAVFDMVYLTGIIAVSLDALVFRRRSKERHHAELPYEEAEVFTVGTSPERLAAWNFPKPAPKQIVHAGTWDERPERVEVPIERTYREAPSLVATERQLARPRPPPPATAAQEDRLARHREWEEQMRRRRGS